jgi:hypothetical protein
MGGLLRDHIRSNVVGYLALFIALTGVTYAANVSKNSVTSRSIKTGAVQSTDVRNNGLFGKDVKELSLAEVPSAASADNAGLLDSLDSGAFVLDTDTAGGDLGGPFSSLAIGAGAVGTEELDTTAVRPQNLAPNGTVGQQATVPMVFLFSIDDGGDITLNAPKNLLVVDVWTIGKSADAGTVTVEGPMNTAITNAIDPEDSQVIRASNIDPGEWNLVAGEVLRADASNTSVDVQVMALAVPNIAP